VQAMVELPPLAEPACPAMETGIDRDPIAFCQSDNLSSNRNHMSCSLVPDHERFTNPVGADPSIMEIMQVGPADSPAPHRNPDIAWTQFRNRFGFDPDVMGSMEPAISGLHLPILPKNRIGRPGGPLRGP